MTGGRRVVAGVVGMVLALVPGLSPGTAGAQEQVARLVKDANRGPGDFRAWIDWVMPVGGGERVVFPMDTVAEGSELWVSDGSPRGTRKLKDVRPGPGGSYPENPVSFAAGKVAFRSDHWTTGDEVWVTDGTEAGTLRAFESEVPGYAGEVVIKAGTSTGLFIEDWNWEVNDAFELRFSDGTGSASGTWVLNPLVGSERARFSMPFSYVTSGPWCYFIANEQEIWRSDGTEAGTSRVMTVTQGWPDHLHVAGGRLFVDVGVASEVHELWTCPMEGGEMTRLGPPAGRTWSWMPEQASAGDELVFLVYDETYARELWASDGTAAGTRRIRLVHGGVESMVHGSLVSWQGGVYLSGGADGGAHELWRADGTEGGARRLASFRPGSAYPVPYEVPASAKLLHFEVWDDSRNKGTLWRTKGDAASTRPVRGAPATNPTMANGPLLAEGEAGTFFVAGTGTPAEALWRTRGTAGGAVRLTRPEKSSADGIAPSPGNALPYEMFGGSLLSFVNTGRGHELWRMDPDGRRSRAIWKTPVPLEEYGSLGFRGITGHGALFTFASAGQGLEQVWVTDGTRRGTLLLAEHGAARNGGSPFDFVKAGGVWFYSVIHEQDGSKAGLWKTDGTRAGTTRVVAADGSAPGPNAWEMVAFQDKVYFMSTGVDGRTALWCSDGTAAGTVRLRDEWHGAAGDLPGSLSVAGGALTFAVRLPQSDVLWRSDGTAAGTAAVIPSEAFSRWSVAPAVDLEGVAVFQAQSRRDSSSQWWRHDDTGTRPVRSYVPGQHLYNGWYRGMANHAVAGGKLFYPGLQNYDAELWVTDGTSDGTRRVKDLNPGPLESSPAEMLAVGDVVYFSAYDEEHGRELWRSDGTEAGTVLVADIQPGPLSSWPQGLKVMGGKLYFHAERRDVGTELFVVDLPAQ